MHQQPVPSDTQAPHTTSHRVLTAALCCPAGTVRIVRNPSLPAPQASALAALAQAPPVPATAAAAPKAAPAAAKQAPAPAEAGGAPGAAQPKVAAASRAPAQGP